jgi:hypothetical protein
VTGGKNDKKPEAAPVAKAQDKLDAKQMVDED